MLKNRGPRVKHTIANPGTSTYSLCDLRLCVPNSKMNMLPVDQVPTLDPASMAERGQWAYAKNVTGGCQKLQAGLFTHLGIGK